MICPNCQTPNPENARFCIECGQLLPRVCPNCGTVNPPGARFCNQCGTLLQTEAAPAVAAPSQSPMAASQLGGARTSEPAASVLPSGGGRTTTTLLVEHAEEHERAEERRVVTVLFADLMSSTTLADGMDAEDVRALLAGFFEMMAREIHRHGGTVEKYIGDAVMAVFGLPLAHEDDPLRAVRAGLDMQAALWRYNEERRAADPGALELRMRLGINTGDVVAASGQAEGRDFLVTGDPVNVAARLQQEAAPGSILVGPRTYRGTSGAVIYRALPPVTLRGKPRPVPVWEVVELVGEGQAPIPRPRGVHGLRAPLIGRDLELELLHTLYSRVTGERRPHLVTVVGVPGVGKTRLAREFLAQALGEAEVDETRRPLVLEGRCPPYGESITYWPLAEMLRAYCDFTALDAPEIARTKVLACVREILTAAGRADDPELLAAYLGYTIGIESKERRQALLPAESQQLQEGIWRAWRVLFEALAAHHPLLAMVDDIHWADDALLDLLEYLAGRATGVPLLLLCPARPELLERRPGWGGGKRNYVTIELEPLSQRDTERLVRELLPEAPESLRAGILGKAEGNPFYVEEIIRMLVDRGILVHNGAEMEAGAGWRVAPEWEESDEVTDPAIPDTVQGVLAARLDLLAEDERHVLQHAAVIGRFFWPSALRRLHPEFSDDDLYEILEALRDKDLIRESERPEASVALAGETIYTFNHALTREVTYAGIPRARRAREHERVAEWLEELARGRETEFADLLAQHYARFYVQSGLARSRNAARRQQVREKVVRYQALAGDQAAARHATAKAERYYTDALALLAEDPVIEDVVRRVELLMKRGDARWLQIQADAAWADYREALRIWSAYSAITVEREPGGEASGRTINVPVAADGAPPLLAQLPSASGSTQTQISLPPDWLIWGLQLYRLVVQLPTRSSSLFQQPPAHEELLPLLDEGLRLAEDLGQRETLVGAELLTAKAFFWWSYAERRGEAELLDALRSAREAVRITEELDAAHGASEALDALGNMQAITTDLRGALESQTRRLVWAQRLEKQPDDVNELVDIYSEVCMAHELVGEYRVAVEHGTQGLRLAETAETEALRARALRGLVVTYFDWDRWPETVEMGTRLVASLMGGGMAQSDATQWALLAYATAHARMGERDESDRVAARVRDQIAGGVQFVSLFRARLALARGAEREARKLLLAALEVRAGRVALPALLAELAELGARSGDRELYERFGAQAQELGWRSGARKALAQAIRARGIVAVADGRWDDALGDLESALNRYRELDTPWEEARTRYALAGCHRRRGEAGDDERAREELREALRLFEELRAVRDIARAKAALAGGDVRLP